MEKLKKINEVPKKEEKLAKIRRREKKYICPVPGCTRSSKPLYLYQHIRCFHKMANDEMKKWKGEAKRSENKVPFVWLGS